MFLARFECDWCGRSFFTIVKSKEITSKDILSSDVCPLCSSIDMSKRPVEVIEVQIKYDVSGEDYGSI